MILQFIPLTVYSQSGVVSKTRLDSDHPPSEDLYSSFMYATTIEEDGSQGTIKEEIEVLRYFYQDSTKEDKDFRKYFDELCFSFLEEHKVGSEAEKKVNCKKIIDEYYKTKLKRADQEDSFMSSTCEWSTDLPRRVVSAPGCGTAAPKKNTCVGYVVCDSKVSYYDDEQKKDVTYLKKFVRMSTCSAENCGDNDSARCTQEKGYSSKKGGEDENVSQQFWNIVAPKGSAQ